MAGTPKRTNSTVGREDQERHAFLFFFLFLFFLVFPREDEEGSDHLEARVRGL